jgi:hypothetical protein
MVTATEFAAAVPATAEIIRGDEGSRYEFILVRDTPENLLAMRRSLGLEVTRKDWGDFDWAERETKSLKLYPHLGECCLYCGDTHNQRELEQPTDATAAEFEEFCAERVTAKRLGLTFGHTDEQVADRDHCANPELRGGVGVASRQDLKALEPLRRFEVDKLTAAGWRLKRRREGLGSADGQGRWHTSDREFVDVTAPSGRTFHF